MILYKAFKYKILEWVLENFANILINNFMQIEKIKKGDFYRKVISKKDQKHYFLRCKVISVYGLGSGVELHCNASNATNENGERPKLVIKTCWQIEDLVFIK